MTDWFGGLLDTVRQKSEVIINMYKEDLQEFTSTITEDTKKAIETNTTAVNAIGGLTNIIQQISGNTLPIGASKSSEDRTSLPHLDPVLYNKEPEDTEDFNNWLSTFDIKSKTDEIAQLLASDEPMRNLHRELVPATVRYEEFWKRYFYYYTKMKEKEDRRAALLQRANAAIASDDSEELGWDLDEFETGKETSNTLALGDENIDLIESDPSTPVTLSEENRNTNPHNMDATQVNQSPTGPPRHFIDMEEREAQTTEPPQIVNPSNQADDWADWE